MGSQSVYLDEPEIKRRELRSSSGGSGERRLGMEVIPGKGRPGLDQIRSEG
jgi:hypothetical protein